MGRKYFEKVGSDPLNFYSIFSVVLSMDKVIVKWSSPYKLKENTPWDEGGKNGLYVILQNPDGSDVVYAGMAGSKRGAVSEARGNRGKYVRRRKMRDLEYDKSEAEVYAGHLSNDDHGRIKLAEALLISFLYRHHGHQIVNSQMLFYENKPPLTILNAIENEGKLPGKVPPCLPHEISSPPSDPI